MSGRAVAVYLLSMGVLIAVEYLSLGWVAGLPLPPPLLVLAAAGYCAAALAGSLRLALAVERRVRARRAER